MPFNVNRAAQKAGIAALDDAAFVARAVAHNERWRPWLERELSALGLAMHPSAANFVLAEFPDPRRDAAAAYSFLLGRGIVPRAWRITECPVSCAFRWGWRTRTAPSWRP